jgi:hypothetical protein
MRLVLIIALLVFVAALTLSGSAAEPPTAYTDAQAAAGKVEIQRNSFGTCTDCHTNALTGRTGDAGEIPALTSLPADYQALIKGNGGRVPPLAGPEFVTRWARRSTKNLTAEFLDRFGPSSGRLSEEIRLDIIAYMLQASGAQAGPQPLTMTTDLGIASLIPAQPSHLPPVQ